MLYLYLKQQANVRKERRRLSSKKRKIYKDNNKLDEPIGLITHFRMTANNDINNLLYTQQAINTKYSHYITYS